MISPARIRAEDGGVLVFVAALTPFLLLLSALVLEIGNWYVHRRHLQLQTDAAALAAGQLFSECITSPSSALLDMETVANTYGSFPSAGYNPQVGGGSGTGTVAAAYESTVYPGGGGGGPDDTADGQDPCTSGMFDVKATESSIPHLFSISPLATVHAHARVELRKLDEQKGLLPVAVPDTRFNYAFATFVDESTGQPLTGCAANCTEELQKGGTLNGQQLWTVESPLDVPISAEHVGVRLRLVGGTDPTAACGTLYTECYDASSSTTGLVHIRGWDGSASMGVQNAWLEAGTCSPDAYFSTADCSAGLMAKVDLGSNHPLDAPGASAQLWATVDGGGNYPLSLDAQGYWDGSGIPISGPGGHWIGIGWSWQQTTGTWNGKTCTSKSNNPCTDKGTFPQIQRAFVASPDDSGPVQQVSVFEQGVSTSGANSFQRGSHHTLGITIAVTGSLRVASEANDPPVYLRVSGSQNQSIDCDPAIPNIRDEIAQGCGPLYTINTTFTCPAYNVLWSTPQPWDCVKTQTGDSVGQIPQGLLDRIFGGSNSCAVAPNNWPDYAADDPRIVPLIVTPFGTFSGSGNDVVPVLDFAAFYVTGWKGDPCLTGTPPPKGYIVGHFIHYIPTNPQGAGDAKCVLDDPSQITPCAAVLTR